MSVTIKPQWLHGNWRAGWALDFHTVSSHPRTGGGFDTDRTAIGQLLYRLKYGSVRSALEPIAETAATFLQTRLIFDSLSAIIPVPPSDLARPFQPVPALASAIGQRVRIPVLLDKLEKVKDVQALKDIEDPEKRRAILRHAFQIEDLSLQGRSVLLFDDVYRSGTTLSEITRVLHEQGGAARVYVLTITKTRSIR